MQKGSSVNIVQELTNESGNQEYPKRFMFFLFSKDLSFPFECQIHARTVFLLPYMLCIDGAYIVSDFGYCQLSVSRDLAIFYYILGMN